MSAIASEAVAAGEGALSTWITRSVSCSRKSSTSEPSGASACARTPARPRTRSCERTSATSRCSERVKARYLELLGRAAPPPKDALEDANLPWPEAIDGKPVLFPRDGYQGGYIVEIAETSVEYDRDVKGRMYADSGVLEYWLVDLSENVLSCYSKPEGGTYRNVRNYRPGESISPELLPEHSIGADELLGD